MQSLLQTPEWGMVKEKQSWQTHWVEGILVLEKSLPLGLSFLYAPEVDFYKIRNDNFLTKIKEIAKKNSAIFTRLDFLNQKSSQINEKIPQILKKQGFIKSFEEIQPEYRQIVSLTRAEEEILAQMKPKGRYNIKIAKKNNIVIEKSDPSTLLGINDFYKIFRETAKRDGFEIRPKQYFENLVKILSEKDMVQVLVAKYEGKAIAAGIFTFYEDFAVYLYGASSNSYRNLMAPYLLHWEAIKEAKRRGCKFYDLLAISPFKQSDYRLQTTAEVRKQKSESFGHKYNGITRFKEQFGGTKIRTIGSWDLVHKPMLYQIFKIAEQLRR